MRRFLLILVALSAFRILQPLAALTAAEPRQSPLAEVRQLRDELKELKQLLEQISERLDGMEKRLDHLETKRPTRIQVMPYPYRPSPWNGIDAGMMLDALEHQQRFGPRVLGHPPQFEPRRLSEPFSVPRLRTPPKAIER